MPQANRRVTKAEGLSWSPMRGDLRPVRAEWAPQRGAVSTRSHVLTPWCCRNLGRVLGAFRRLLTAFNSFFAWVFYVPWPLGRKRRLFTQLNFFRFLGRGGGAKNRRQPSKKTRFCEQFVTLLYFFSFSYDTKYVKTCPDPPETCPSLRLPLRRPSRHPRRLCSKERCPTIPCPTPSH